MLDIEHGEPHAMLGLKTFALDFDIFERGDEEKE
jgi:hypothetical protein